MSNTDNTSNTFTPNQLSEILELHKKWIGGEPGGVRANLHRANLEGANLRGANLRGANMWYANLTGAILTEANLTEANLTEAILTEAILYRANLTGAILTGAILTEAILTGANLTRANLTRANLRGANMWYANLTEANLTEANLRGANLRGANLHRANLTRANLTGADMTGSILEGASLPPPVIDLAGTKVGYKKVWNNDKSARVVIELRFPEGSKLVSTVIGRRKCRASKAEVVRCVSTGFEQEMEFQSMHDRNFVYRVGETVKPRAAFDDRITVECTSGIHFFVTREEAEAYNY